MRFKDVQKVHDHPGILPLVQYGVGYDRNNLQSVRIPATPRCYYQHRC